MKLGFTNKNRGSDDDEDNKFGFVPHMFANKNAAV
jgi:hypothetical protein